MVLKYSKRGCVRVRVCVCVCACVTCVVSRVSPAPARGELLVRVVCEMIHGQREAAVSAIVRVNQSEGMLHDTHYTATEQTENDTLS